MDLKQSSPASVAMVSTPLAMVSRLLVLGLVRGALAAMCDAEYRAVECPK